jgi:hypothetical protein
MAPAGSLPTLVINELVNVVTLGKAREQLFTMLVHSRFKIAGDTGVEHGVSLVGKDIYAINLFHRFTGRCEKHSDEAIWIGQAARDCFAALAMTGEV